MKRSFFFPLFGPIGEAIFRSESVTEHFNLSSGQQPSSRSTFLSIGWVCRAAADLPCSSWVKWWATETISTCAQGGWIQFRRLLLFSSSEVSVHGLVVVDVWQKGWYISNHEWEFPTPGNNNHRSSDAACAWSPEHFRLSTLALFFRPMSLTEPIRRPSKSHEEVVTPLFQPDTWKSNGLTLTTVQFIQLFQLSVCLCLSLSLPRISWIAS